MVYGAVPSHSTSLAATYGVLYADRAIGHGERETLGVIGERVVCEIEGKEDTVEDT